MSWFSKSVSKPLDKVAAVVNPGSILPSVLTKGKIPALKMSEIEAAVGAGAYALMPGAAGAGATAAAGAGAGATSAGGFMRAMAPGIIPGLLGAGASIYGARQQAESQQQANEANVELAREQMNFSAAQAQKEMDFQQASADKEMNFQQVSADKQMAFQDHESSTSYQRAVADMKAAGINPMLAIDNGGASSPAGSSGSGASASGAMGSYSPAHVSPIPSAVANSLSSSLDMVRTYASFKQALASADQAEAISAKAKADTKGREMENIRSGRSLDIENEHPRLTGWLDAIMRRLPLINSAKDSLNMIPMGGE